MKALQRRTLSMRTVYVRAVDLSLEKHATNNGFFLVDILLQFLSCHKFNDLIILLD